MMKKLLSTLLAVCLTVSLTACGGSQDSSSGTDGNSSSGGSGAEAGDTIRIGVAAPITGDMAETGIMMDVGSRMAVDEINAAGGINGRKIELVLYDTKADPKESTEVARKLVEDSTIMAVCGDTTTSQVMAAAPIYEEGGLVQLTPTASGNDFPAMGQYQFSLAGRAADEIPAYIQNVLVDTMDCKRLGIIYMNNDWGMDIVNNIQRELEDSDIEIVALEGFMEGETDFSSALAKIRQSEPDVLLVGAQYTEGSAIAQQVVSMGWDVPMTTQGSLVQPAFCKLVGDIPFYGQAPIVFTEAVPDAYEFAQKFTELSGGLQPSMRASCTYNVIQALALAIEACGDDITRSNIRDHLAEIKDMPVLGGTTVTFEEEGYVHLQYLVVTIKDGEWVPLEK